MNYLTVSDQSMNIIRTEFLKHVVFGMIDDDDLICVCALELTNRIPN